MPCSWPPHPWERFPGACQAKGVSQRLGVPWGPSPRETGRPGSSQAPLSMWTASPFPQNPRLSWILSLQVRGAASWPCWAGHPARGRFFGPRHAAEAGAAWRGWRPPLGRGSGAPRRPAAVLVGGSRAPGRMAAAGTCGAEGAFASPKEEVLDRLCWLDGGCEQARRGYLHAQLCCVGVYPREGRGPPGRSVGCEAEPA